METPKKDHQITRIQGNAGYRFEPYCEVAVQDVQHGFFSKNRDPLPFESPKELSNLESFNSSEIWRDNKKQPVSPIARSIDFELKNSREVGDQNARRALNT